MLPAGDACYLDKDWLAVQCSVPTIPSCFVVSKTVRTFSELPQSPPQGNIISLRLIECLLGGGFLSIVPSGLE